MTLDYDDHQEWHSAVLVSLGKSASHAQPMWVSSGFPDFPALKTIPECTMATVNCPQCVNESILRIHGYTGEDKAVKTYY